MKEALISLTGFIAVFFAFLGLAMQLTKEERIINERLRKISLLTRHFVRLKDQKSGAAGIDIQKILHNAGKLFAPQGVSKRVEGQLARADLPLRAEEYLMLRILLAAVPPALLFIAARNVVYGLVFFVLGIIIPPFLVRMSQQKRLKKINYQLIDCLSIISNSLRAGYSFMQAIELVSREMPGPLGAEFARVFREINLGAATEEALLNMGERIGSDDINLVVTAVLIQRQIGGNLAEILDNISFTIRERIRIQGEIRTLTAQGRISGMIIALIPPFIVLAIVLINPGYMQPLFTTAPGAALLLGGAAGELVGVLIIRKIVSINI